MNQRIEEFAKQCYVKTGSHHTDHFEYWKFAELIVNETADWINDNVGMIDEDARADLLKHFGINRE